MKIFMEGFPINIAGKRQAMWTGLKGECPKCKCEVGVAKYSDNRELVLFSLLVDNADEHNCELDKEILKKNLGEEQNVTTVFQ